MLWRVGDGAHLAHSLDDIYYFGGQQEHLVTAWLPHSSPPSSPQSNVLSFRIGDDIGIAGNHWNGYSKGSRLLASLGEENGFFPSYKVVEHFRTISFPTYYNGAAAPSVNTTPIDVGFTVY